MIGMVASAKKEISHQYSPMTIKDTISPKKSVGKFDA